ncbi:S9 family peptidase [Rapidithrix thailandica]|uniref:Proline-specific endopeptidase n=1 Tax=Rapidithrix thailandica TaxID=413964 RepID=A0AAW9S025_9BACT
MKIPNHFLISLTTLGLSGGIISCNSIHKEQTMQAPKAEKEAKQLTLHGDTRTDDYYWMRLTDEQKNAETPDAHTQKVIDYLDAENEYTQKQLSHTEALQDTLYQEIVGRIKQTDESVPYFENGYWYYTRYEEGKEYPIYCRKLKTLEAEEEVLLNVNEMAVGKNYYSVSGLEVSPDNKLLAFGVDTLSRRIYTIRFKNLETGEVLSDEIPGTTAGGAWANDNAHYFYTAKNETTLLPEKILRHRLGEAASDDAIVYKEEDPSYYIGVYKSKSDKYVIIWNSSTLSSDFHILNADHPEDDFQQFTPREEVHEYQIEHFEDKFYIVSNWEAKNFRLMETAEKATEKSQWKEVIAHREDVLLEGIEIFKNHMVVDERKNGLTQLRIIHQKTGEEHYLDFGEPAYTAYVSTNPEFATEQLRFGYSSLTTPNSIYDYNMNSKEKVLKKRSEVIGGHNPEEYTTERLYATARDGKKVPISLVYKKGFEKNGQAPLLLYAYGSYGSTMDAYFSSARLSLLDRGFAFAIAHIRGGQALGREWYEEGKMLKKKNTFYDYIDCSKFLIEQQYSNPEKLFAMGGSAGGLLMGAVVNMAPELYRGVVAAVPFVDVITTMSDPSIPLTTNEYDEWGNPEDKEYYEYMKTYSPYDNVSKQAYPNMLVTTGLFDSQVQYWEPAKWVAKLREYKTDHNLLLMHTNMEAGHSGASGRFKRYKEMALEYAFMLDLAGIKQ